MAEVEPFVFRKARHITEMTDLRARDLTELLHGIVLASEDSLFFHMHRLFLFQPSVEPAYPNDFSHWAGAVLGALVVAERFADVNPLQFSTIADVRHELARILAEHFRSRPELRAVEPAHEFAFRWARAVVLPTRCRAFTLTELAECIEKVEAASLYWHVFDGRRRLRGHGNDFSEWLRAVGRSELAQRVDELDVYTLSLDETRGRLAGIVREGARP